MMKVRFHGKTLEIDRQRLTGKGGVNQHAGMPSNGPEPVSNRPLPPRYDSQLEADYATYLWGLEKAVDILGWRYHPWTFLLPGGVKYTPDFLVIDQSLEHSGGQVWVEIHELKGSTKMKNARDGITRFRIAKGLFPWFTWKLIERERGQWRQVD